MPRPLTSDVSVRVAKIVRAVETVSAELPEADRPRFEKFVGLIARQLRAPFVARHSANGVPRSLLPLYRMLEVRTGNDILVEIDERGEGGVVVRTCMPDQPFIVDTVRLLLHSRGAAYDSGFNAVLPVQRDKEGRLVSVGEEGGALESIIQIEASRFGDEDPKEVAERLRQNLAMSKAMVEDFGAMTHVVDRLASRFSRLAQRFPANADAYRETGEFLNWLLADNFVFMGAVADEDRYGFERIELRDEMLLSDTESWDDSPWPELPVQVRKGVVESPVHRSGRVDEILVRVPDESGKHAHDVRLRGMFTYRAVTQTSRSVPILRQVLAQILQQEASRPGSWRYKGVANVFDSLPTEYLFTAQVEEIGQMVERVLDAEAEQQVRVHIVHKPRSNMTFALAAMPRAQFSDQLRKRMEGTLIEGTGATYSDHGVFVGRFETVLIYFYLTGGEALVDDGLEQLRVALTELATPWEDRVYVTLCERYGEEQADRLIARYGGAFDEEYVTRNSSERTVTDLGYLERISDEEPVIADLFVDHKGRPCLRIYQRGNVILSDILPVLDNFGLIVNDQYADPVHPRGAHVADIDTFRLRGVWGLETDELVARKQLLIDGLSAVFRGDLIDDTLNRLMLRAGLRWQDVDLLRAYRGYARQLGLRLPISRVQEILLNQVEMAKRLVEYFHARFSPDLDEGTRLRLMADSAERVEAGLRGVHNQDEDKLIRNIYNLMQASLRTSFFREDRERYYISFKVDHDLVPSMPEPRMKYEIYVHHPEVEGVHLRGGEVARGGIRWSDRTDYRTEILGLVATQMVKNVLIVPEGAKGGFLLRHVIRDRDERRAKADEMYRYFIRGLLDVTDNYVDGKLVHPPRVVIHDGPDPYLVVAADKGTAHLSDTANAVSAEYGFWLRDAFASGGSNGYDHKEVGITARGGWECVDRHFAEMGLDPKTQTFTCVGVGDCGGDVFGNGVVQYDTMKLLAAFNHLHVFLDPDPDPASSYVERRRLFDEVKGWEHYDVSKISEGGGVYSRTAKSIPLSPQAKAMLGALHDELTPEEVIRHILRMPVDLLWNGGIGTYVKASHETHLDAGDPSNDVLRVDASELRCKAVGEGGNLGFTQAGRIEFALDGGRVNTDAVDNSGGVDMSDHEVNLKILLAGEVDAGRLGMEARNTLIEALTDEVADAVLANNDAHARQLSLDQLRSLRDPMAYARTVQWVTQLSGASLAALKLPTAAELKQRRQARKGLTRPELATLAAYVKMHVYKALQQANADWIPSFNERLLSYFPQAVRERFPDGVREHMLAKQIGMTVVLTEVVADAGATFFPTLIDLTHRHVGEIAGAFLRASAAFDLGTLRREISRGVDALDGRYHAWIAITDGLQRLLAAWLAPGELAVSDTEIRRTVHILGRIPGLRSRSEADISEHRITSLLNKGVPRELALQAASMGDLTLAREIVLMQGRTHDSDRDAIVRYLAIGEASGLLSAIRALEARRTAGAWDPIASGILRTRYFQLLRNLLETTPLGAELKLGTDSLVLELRNGKLRAIAQDMDAILGDVADLGAFLVAEERLRAAVLG
ncbi:MAG: NAD-glutamate dehydrogenase [Alphaproteobacteria bacterium]|nr:NAD-glutamate dehydrogenase [Alphaproteobacteria bacterium]